MLRPGCYTHVHNPLAFVGCLITFMYLFCTLNMKKLFGTTIIYSVDFIKRTVLLNVLFQNNFLSLSNVPYIGKFQGR